MRGGSDDGVRGMRLTAHAGPAGSYAVELLRYGAASALAFAADFATLVLMTEKAGVHYLASAAVGFSVGILVAYVLSIRWVFASRRMTNVAAESTIFLLIGVAGLIVNHFVMFGLTEVALLPYPISKIGSAGMVFSFNFYLRKSALFTVPLAPKG
jgi:putative flippase GtrA